MVGVSDISQRYARWLLGHRALTVAIVAVVSVLAALSARGLRFDNAIDIWLLDDNPELQRYRSFLEEFGTDEFIVLAWETDDFLEAAELGRIRRLGRAIARLQHVRNVFSLTEADVPTADAEGVTVGPMVDDLPGDPEAVEALRYRVLAHPMLVGRVVAADGKSLALIAEVEHIEDDFIYKVELVRQIRAIVEEERARTGVRPYHLAGGPVLDDAIFRYSIRDTLVYLPLCVLFAAAVTFFIFRRLSAVVVVMLVVVQSVLWTAGAMAVWGLRANIISTILVPVLMCAGIGEAIHIVAEYYAQLGRGRDRLAAMAVSLDTLMAPCLVTSMTTAAGLLSLGVSDLGVLRETGCIGAFGILVGFGLSMTMLPAVLTWVPAETERSLEPRESDRLAWFLTRAGQASVGWRGSVLICSALLVLAGGLGITRLTVNANFIDHFRKNDPVRLDTEFVDEHLQGTVSIEFVLRAPERNGILEPTVLRALEALETFVESLPGVTSVHGLCEALREIHGVLRGGGPSAAVLPDNARLAAQLLLAMEGSGITESIVDAERRVARLSAYVRVKDSMALASHVREIEAFLKRHFPPPLSASMTGVVKVSQDVQDYILTTQIDSLSLSVITSIAMIALLLGSVRLGLLAMIPNLIPLGMTLGFMGLVGISLNVGTVMIAAVVLGVIVDDTVHFLVCYRRAYGSGLSVHQAVQHTLEKVGRPIVATSLILVAGFWVMMLATFRPNVNFGLLTGVTIMIGLVADLMILPAALAVVRPRMLRVRSGEMG